MTHCEYWDAGWCYSPKGIKNNASSSGACLEPKNCPYLITKECRQTGRTNATTNKLLKLSETQMDEPVKYETPMTVTEDLKAQIKVLTAKLALLEEMDKHKSPAEEAFKKVYNRYPMTDVNDTCWDGSTWIDFKFGYNAAQEDYKVGDYQPTPQTENEVAEGLKEAFREAQQTEEWKETQRKIEEDNGKNFKNSIDLIREWGEKNKPKTLYQICMEWWDEVFVNEMDDDICIDVLVSRIDKEFIPPSYDRNGYEWEKCLKMMRDKLR